MSERTVFKKPKRNFIRQRKYDSSESDEEYAQESYSQVNDVDPAEGVIPVIKKTKKKVKKNSIDSNESNKKDQPKLLVSFGEDEEDTTEFFKVKKSSLSRKIAKQSKREKRADKSSAKPEVNTQQSLPGEYSDIKIKELKSLVKPKPDFENEVEIQIPEEEESPEVPFMSVLETGIIPDARTIYELKKKREQARQQGNAMAAADFISIEREEKAEKSRLIREDDNDHSDDDDDCKRMGFSTNEAAEQRRAVRANFLAVEHGDSDEERDEEFDQWEKEQIRKGVSIPQVQTSQQPQPVSDYYQQYLYQQQSNIFQPQPAVYDHLKSDSSFDRPTAKKAVGAPSVTSDNVITSLRDRLADLEEVHKAHKNEHDSVQDRLISCESHIVELENDVSKLASRYQFFQEMRGYVNDLADCLAEKMPQIEALDHAMHLLLKNRAQKFLLRRQADIKDQSDDNRPGKPVMQGLELEEKRRRVAEREARRARRRRAREKAFILGEMHNEGMSSDDEEMESEIDRFRTEQTRILTDAGLILEDVVDDFSTFRGIRTQFEKWKHNYGDIYQEAYISLCLPKVFTPLLKLQLIGWNALESSNVMDEWGWYDDVLMYGFEEKAELSSEDPDTKLIPSLLEKVLLVKLATQIEDLWDPLSSSQTLNLCKLLKKLVSDYPTMTGESKNMQALLRAVIRRVRVTLDDDVFIPLYPKNLLEFKNSPANQFLQRQFWSCVKLLKNVVQFTGILSDTVVQELVLDCLLNRYMLLALQTSNMGPDVIERCKIIATTFPKSWFKHLTGDSTLPKLEPFCRLIVHLANVSAKQAETRNNVSECEENVKQLTKLLVTIYAMDHAVSLGSLE